MWLGVRVKVSYSRLVLAGPGTCLATITFLVIVAEVGDFVFSV
ncbi:MAG: hypothetical protein ACI85S_001921 [Pseudohongiellaceae bacterium]|jgi:hypothetical protein